ncbi:hypothetical protein MMC31_001135, partial [Peltigera leucophlebia]|nr:hypothetical protein [Peltigera leucophlebia]
EETILPRVLELRTTHLGERAILTDLYQPLQTDEEEDDCCKDNVDLLKSKTSLEKCIMDDIVCHQYPKPGHQKCSKPVGKLRIARVLVDKAHDIRGTITAFFKNPVRLVADGASTWFITATPLPKLAKSLFLQGLPPPIQSELFNHYNINLDGDAVLDFEGILKKAYSLIETRKKMVELGTTDIKNDSMSDLVDRSAKKTQLDHPFSGPSTLSNYVLQVPIVPTAPLITAPPSQNDKKIDILTDMMRSLALSVRTLQGSTNVMG